MRKAVVPAAGLGERLRPITTAIPKEMFPIGRYAAIEWVMAEAVSSGFDEIAVISRTGKELLERYLRENVPELRKHRVEILLQSRPAGLAHALTLARSFCAEEPFAVLLPDDLAEPSCLPLKQMQSLAAAAGEATIAVAKDIHRPPNRTCRFRLGAAEGRVLRVEGVGADPGCADAGLRGFGRYLLTPIFFDYAEAAIENSPGGTVGDGAVLQRMIEGGCKVHGVELDGRFFDISSAEGHAEAIRRLGDTKPVWRACDLNPPAGVD